MSIFFFHFSMPMRLIVPWGAAARDPCAVLLDPVDADPDKEKSCKKVVKDDSGDNCGYPEHTAFHYVQDLICT